MALDNAHGASALGTHGPLHWFTTSGVWIAVDFVRGAGNGDVLLGDNEGVRSNAAGAAFAGLAVACQG